MSLNETCRDAFVAYASAGACASRADGHSVPSATERVRKAVRSDVLGVVLFGSCSRGEQRNSSDVDLLVVVPDSIRLGRELYQHWDEAEQDRSFSPHFVHLPKDPLSAGSIWYEVALDGIVIEERDYLVSRFLQRVRRAIADGYIERATSHGHGYWIKHPEAEDAE